MRSVANLLNIQKTDLSDLALARRSSFLSYTQLLFDHLLSFVDQKPSISCESMHILLLHIIKN